MRIKSNQGGSAPIVALILVLLLLVGFTWGKYYWSARTDPVMVECRHNLLSLTTALEISHALTGSFEVDSLGTLRGLVEESFDLICPRNNLPYTYFASPDSYQVSCPNGHGVIDAGRVPWRQ
ncbi:hypothetical protein ACFLT7_07775 [candidate division KSB1 bacterium]